MRRTVAFPVAVAGSVLAVIATAAPASAHGYVSTPPSRQALCAARSVPDCGQIQFEPQSVEGPKGLRNCSANLPQFAVLDDESRNWPATSVGTRVDFSWVLTARHATSTWQYFIGDRLVASFDDGGRQPDATVTHSVDLSGFSGRQKVLAVWNIADTAMAFYACIDVQISGTTPPTTGPPTPTTTTVPPAPVDPTPPPTTVPPDPVDPAPATTWAAGTTYRIGDRVVHRGVTYDCRQAHRAQSDWEPQLTLALWLPVPGGLGNRYRAI